MHGSGRLSLRNRRFLKATNLKSNNTYLLINPAVPPPDPVAAPPDLIAAPSNPVAPTADPIATPTGPIAAPVAPCPKFAMRKVPRALKELQS